MIILPAIVAISLYANMIAFPGFVGWISLMFITLFVVLMTDNESASTTYRSFRLMVALTILFIIGVMR